MISFLTAPQNAPFAIAIGVMLIIAVLEGVTTVLGFALSGFLDSLMPDFGLDVDVDVDMDADADLDIDHAGATTASLSKLLSWLRVGEVPVLMLFIVFLTCFGLMGLALQTVARNTMGVLLPGLIASAGTFIVSLPVYRLFSGLMARYMPKDETYAVSEKSFIGRVATVTLGTAKTGQSAQAKLRDTYGQTHYVMIEPDQDDETFQQGDSTILVRQQGAVFRAIRNTSDALRDDD